MPAPQEPDESDAVSRSAALYEGVGATVTRAHLLVAGRRYPVAALDEIERVEQGGLLQSRCYELWASYRGQRLRLFRCRDAREFGQICRALTRAREYAGVA